MTFKLEPFQVPAHRQLVTNFRHLLLMEPGLGKTVVCVKALYDLQSRCVLIVCPKNAIKVWENHIREWFDGLDVALGKTPEEEVTFHIWRWRKRQHDAAKRQALWRSIDRDAKVNIYITTYGAFVRDQAQHIQAYDAIIIDEAKRLRGRRGKAFSYLQQIIKRVNPKCVWPLTGTPGHEPKHYWTMFNLIAAKQYGSYWNFIEAFYVTIKGAFGQKEIVAFKNQDSWFDLLRRKTSIVTKKQIGHRETMRALKYAEFNDVQERYYKQYEEEMYADLEDGIDIVSTSLTQTLRYRQLLCCPAIIDPNWGVGGALTDLVESFKEGDHDPHCVIFVPFTAAFVHYLRYLSEHGYENVQTLQGGLDPDELDRRISTWRQSRVPIICSIMYAQAFSLEPASECFFIGREWDPDDNKQAEERLNRLTTKHAITAWYYTYEGTYDERQWEILDQKTRTQQKTSTKN